MSSKGLLNLPTECLEQIVEYTIPEGFEGISLTCKTAHAVSLRFMPSYNPRRKRFANFKWSRAGPRARRLIRFGQPVPDELRDEESRRTGYYIPHALELLEAISKEPILARFIRTIKFVEAPEFDDSDSGSESLGDASNSPNGDETARSNDGNPEGSNADHADNADAHSDESSDVDDESVQSEESLTEISISSELRDLIRDSPDIAAIGSDPEDWIHDLEHFHMEEHLPGRAVLFLLAILPNVHALRLPERWSKDWHEASGTRFQTATAGPLLDRIVERANDPTLTDASLSRLVTLLPNAGIGYRMCNALDHNMVLAGIQSLRELYVGGSIGIIDNHQFPHLHLSFDLRYDWSQNLEIIELVGVSIGREELDYILEKANRGSRLRSFRLEYERKRAPTGWHWDAGGCLVAVQQQCAESLEDLTMFRIDEYTGDRGLSITDMTRFRKLKRLEVDVAMFCGPSYEIHATLDANADLDSERGPPFYPALVKMLPASIEIVVLRLSAGSVARYTCLRRMFEGFREDASTELPKLENIFLIVTDLDEQLGEQGVEAVDFAVSSGAKRRDQFTRAGMGGGRKVSYPLRGWYGY